MEVEVQCPYCFEVFEIWIDPMSRGELVRDCEVCCRPWLMHVQVQQDPWDDTRRAHVSVKRAQ